MKTVSRRTGVRSLTGAVLAGVVLVGVAAGAVPAGAAAATPAGSSAGSPRVIDDGHVDIGPRLVDGRWTIQVRDDARGRSDWRPASEVVLHASDTAKATVPDAPAFSFLGPTGSTVWLLPQVQQPGVAWVGWNTQDPSIAGLITREVTWTLRDVDGPGEFVLFLNGDFGTPRIVFDSNRAMPQETGIAADTHVHGNWAFTAPGAYRLAVEMTATATDGRRSSATDTIRVFVGHGEPAAAFPTADPSTADPSAADPSAAGSAPSGSDSAGSARSTARSAAGDGSAAVPVLVWWGAGAAMLLVAGVLAAFVVIRRRRGTPDAG